MLKEYGEAIGGGGGGGGRGDSGGRGADGVGDGEAVDATEAVVVFRLGGGGGGAAVPPMHLCGGGGGDERSVCFSLAPMGLKARRHFLREVMPRWKSAAESAGVSCHGSQPPFVDATRAQRWAVAQERVVAAATAAASASHKTYLTHAPDALVVAAAAAASGIAVVPPAPAAAAANVTAAAAASAAAADAAAAGVVPVTLLTGTPDGCQDDVARALVDFASSTATWVTVEVPLREGGGLCTSRDVLERVIHDALPRVQAAAAARHAASSADAPPPHVLFIARTYQPAAAVGLALNRALSAVSQLSQLSGAAVELRLGAVTACVSSDGFFSEAERQPAFGTLSQLVPAAANNVVVLPSGAATATAAAAAAADESANNVVDGGGGSAGGGEQRSNNNAAGSGSGPGPAPPTAAELAAEATSWVRSLAGATSAAKGGGRSVNVIVGGTLSSIHSHTRTRFLCFLYMSPRLQSVVK